jgi:YVTN family beta-propeller protein
MEYRVLGPLEVRDGAESIPLAGAKQRALLALLLVNANHVVSRDRLIEELWGEQPPETAVQSVQVYVSRLRKLLPPDTLLTRAPGYLLEIEPDELDLRRFERLLAHGRKAIGAGDPEHAAAVLHEALALWRGPALAEFAFEPFAQTEIGRLEDLRLAAVEERLEADLALGRHPDLIGELEALIAEHPYRERLRAQLMLALYRSGRQAEALEAYQEARRVLVDELGIEPSEELQKLEKQILTHDKELASPARPQRARPPAPQPALERKRVTVLFADLALADELEQDPEQAAAFLDRVHDEAEAEIEAAGGTVEKGVAGALLATFSRQQDHGVRAVSAALATRNRLMDVFGDDLSLRMAVESGEVILGRPGSFVTGTPVAAAARLVRLAGPAEVIVGERAATASAGAFELQQRGGAYVLVGALAPTRSPAQIRRRRRLLGVAGALLAAAAIAAIVAFATRETPISVPPNSVALIDPKTNKVVDYVQTGIRPGPVVVTRDAVWVGNLDDRSLSRIDPETRKVVHTILLNATPTDLAVAPDGVWVAYGFSGALARVAPEYNRQSEPVILHINPQVGGARGSVVFGDKSIWVAYGDSSVFRIDPATGRVIASMTAGNSPSAIAFGIDSLWVANWIDGTVTRFNASTNGVRTQISVGQHPIGVAVGAGAVWATGAGADNVTRIDSVSNSVTAAIVVGRAPAGIAYGVNSVWVANSGDGTVSRIDPRTDRVVATIHVGNSPSGIAIRNGTVWVTIQAAPSS